MRRPARPRRAGASAARGESPSWAHRRLDRAIPEGTGLREPDDQLPHVAAAAGERVAQAGQRALIRFLLAARVAETKPLAHDAIADLGAPGQPAGQVLRAVERPVDVPGADDLAAGHD